MSTVLVADPHPAMATAIAEVLERESCTTILARAGDLPGLAWLLARHKPDVLLLDPALLGSDGLQALPMLRNVSPATKVLLIAMDEEGVWVRHAERCGAAGYIPKSAPAAAWGRAVAAAADDEAAQVP